MGILLLVLVSYQFVQTCNWNNLLVNSNGLILAAGLFGARLCDECCKAAWPCVRLLFHFLTSFLQFGSQVLALRPVPKAGLTLWDGFSLSPRLCRSLSAWHCTLHYETSIEGLGTTFLCLLRHLTNPLSLTQIQIQIQIQIQMLRQLTNPLSLTQLCFSITTPPHLSNALPSFGR